MADHLPVSHAIVCSFVGCNHELIQRAAAAVAVAPPLPEKKNPPIKLEPFFYSDRQNCTSYLLEKRGNHNHGKMV